MAVWKEENVGRITWKLIKNITVGVNNFMASLITEINVVYLFTIDQAKDIHSPHTYNRFFFHIL